MKIIITDDRIKTNFDKVGVGDAFEYADEIWMRTCDVKVNAPKENGKVGCQLANAVNLATGKLFCFEPIDQVGLIETEVVANRVYSKTSEPTIQYVVREESIVDKVIKWINS